MSVANTVCVCAWTCVFFSTHMQENVVEPALIWCKDSVTYLANLHGTFMGIVETCFKWSEEMFVSQLV